MQLPDWESSLASECASGDRTAQKRLYERFCDEMLVLCLRYIPEREDAREALMDGFLACFKAIGSFSYRGPGSLRAWMKQVTINACLQRLRKRTAPPQAELDTYGEAIGVDAEALDRLSAREILRLVQALPDGYRTVFNLYCFEGQSHKEIATAMGISEATSKSQLSKARARLRKLLPEHNHNR